MKIVLKIFLIAALLSCKSNKEEKQEDDLYIMAGQEQAQANPVQQSESYKRGKEVYNDFCVTCHLANGKGISGAFPPLDGSNWLTKKRTESISAVKHGLKGPIEVNGEEYNSVMVDLGLTDEEVADVMNYINNSWSNRIEEPVTVEEVAKVEK
ncbi:cytochrome c [Antarcticibacterium sp. 1MA-6-2]|uniref:c-type cytochrome n=1 Tax=Antarcticibacterium sp. 1MA-6-2 TaxID=2908210 RepID=UPI001F1F0EE5|nr:cytochrome c [Antarcticibacterium sp. 1MA-6-2]UJH92103.1 cytochrome c [Antarcticibacterium sp. 1MA-6-2]